MSSVRSLLVFNLDETQFGVDVSHVRELVWLPELTPIEEAPIYIVGMFSLRNQLVPVTDLNLRFGHPARPFRINDQVVVLEFDRQLMGVVVSEGLEVTEVLLESIQPALKFHTETFPSATLIEGEVLVGDGIVTLLNTKLLVNLSQDLIAVEAEHPAIHFCPEATPAQHAIYRARARALMENLLDGEGDQLALIVVEIGREFFGIELETVQEFCEISHHRPIPCCPPHILGAISLRGSLLTLLDLRSALNLPNSPHVSNKVVVARLDQQIIGISIDEFHDVVYLRQEELMTAPVVLLEQCGKEIKGAAHYDDKVMVILDLPMLLAREEWIVNENV